MKVQSQFEKDLHSEVHIFRTTPKHVFFIMSPFVSDMQTAPIVTQINHMQKITAKTPTKYAYDLKCATLGEVAAIH